MKYKFFWRNFLRLIASVLIPLILLGPVTVFITYKYAVSQANQNSLDILHLASENLELMLGYADFLTESLDHNGKNASTVKSILRSPEYSYDLIKNLEFISGLMAVPTNSKSYIHSIYIYVENPYGRFLTSNSKISSIATAYDNTWYDSYINTKPEVRQWVEARYAKSYSSDENPQQVISLYRRLSNNNGVIVLNIRQSYFYNMISQLIRYNQKNLIVIGHNAELLFSSIPQFDPAACGLVFDRYPPEKPVSVRIGEESQLMTILKSDRFNWTYVSFVPFSILYSVPRRILSLILAILFITIVIDLILTYSLSRKNYRQMMNIIDVFHAAEKGKPLPLMSEHAVDEYSYVLQNILKTFIEQDYLKMQLSLKQLSLKNAELLALQSQLNPHFLYNTLETINLEFLTITQKPTNLNRMITQLALILQYALESPGGTVPLGREIENTKRYVEIQAYRYEDKFFVRWNIGEAAFDFPVIPLLLQPLVENSIYHGIKEKKGRCGIKISICNKLDGLYIRITDNGLGIIAEDLAKIRYNLAHPEIDKEGHIGLYNANKRLALTFGERYHISIYSRYTIGTSIHLFLPVRYIDHL